MRIAIAGLANREVARLQQKLPEHVLIHIDSNTYRGIHKGSPDMIVTTAHTGHQLSQRIRAQLPHIPLRHCYAHGQSRVKAYLDELLTDPNHLSRPPS